MPETTAKHDHILRTFFIVRGAEGAPENRLGRQHIEETASDLCNVRVGGDTVIDHDCAAHAISRHTSSFLE